MAGILVLAVSASVVWAAIVPSPPARPHHIIRVDGLAYCGLAYMVYPRSGRHVDALVPCGYSAPKDGR